MKKMKKALAACNGAPAESRDAFRVKPFSSLYGTALRFFLPVLSAPPPLQHPSAGSGWRFEIFAHHSTIKLRSQLHSSFKHKSYK